MTTVCPEAGKYKRVKKKRHRGGSLRVCLPFYLFFLAFHVNLPFWLVGSLLLICIIPNDYMLLGLERFLTLQDGEVAFVRDNVRAAHRGGLRGGDHAFERGDEARQLLVQHPQLLAIVSWIFVRAVHGSGPFSRVGPLLPGWAPSHGLGPFSRIGPFSRVASLRARVTRSVP